ncbi:MAG: COX15/CtaA family protein, partial [Pseudomonadota bacterium]|nr:COX15/CtaA family protein [Pseudomonadota bacterium]
SFGIPLFWWRAMRVPASRRLQAGFDLLLAALVLQIALGISTLLLVVPVTLAAAHQAGAILLFTASLFVSHQLHRQAQTA